MRDVLCVGEALCDLVTTRRGRLGDSPAFTRYAGGAPANVARGLARLGAKVGWQWAVGDDEFGRFLLETLTRDGVDISRAIRTKQGKTGLAFIALAEDGERTFTGYGQPDAGQFFAADSVDADYVAGFRVLHFGSNTLIVDPARTATLQLIAAARAAGRYTSLDVNLRLHLWSDSRRVQAAVRQTMGGLDVVKCAEEEATFLTGEEDPLLAAHLLRRQGAGLAIVTRGAMGCVFAAQSCEGEVRGFAVEVRDATGAGDAFQAGLWHALLPLLGCDDDGGPGPSELPEDVLASVLTAANAAGAAAVHTLGACEWQASDRPTPP